MHLFVLFSPLYISVVTSVYFSSRYPALVRGISGREEKNTLMTTHFLCVSPTFFLCVHFFVLFLLCVSPTFFYLRFGARRFCHRIFCFGDSPPLALSWGGITVVRRENICRVATLILSRARVCPRAPQDEGKQLIVRGVFFILHLGARFKCIIGRIRG